MSQWISIASRKPAQFARCLIWNGKSVEEDLFLTVMFHKESHGLWKATHWMPFPTPPQEDDQ